VRRLLVLIALSSTAYAGRPSNPAFLGIGMEDARTRMNLDGCWVDSVTPSSGADVAGLRVGDVIQALDGTPAASCMQLSEQIIGHAPGDLVHLDVVRLGERHTLRAQLSSRAEILHRRFVNKPFDVQGATDATDGRDVDSGEWRGGTTIVVWFDIRHCGGCTGVVQRLADAVRAPRRGTAPRIVAATYGQPDELRQRGALSLGVPLVIVDPQQYEQAATSDTDRVFVMVLDGRGIVRFVTPIAYDDEAVDGTLDEVVAAAEQAEHRRK
jgi:hypothetical protein